MMASHPAPTIDRLTEARQEQPAMDVSSNPGFMFVACDGLTGKPSKKNRSLINSHIMLRQAVANPKSNAISPWSIHMDHSGTSKSPFEDDNPNRKPSKFVKVFPDSIAPRGPRALNQNTVERQSRNGSKKQTCELQKAVRKNRPRVQNAASPLVALGLTDTAFNKICKYYFYSQDDPRSFSYQVARQQWAETGWDIGRTNAFFHECLVLYAYRKQFELTGSAKDYLLQTGHVVKMLQKQARDGLLEPLTLVAIGILAYCALLDCDLATTRIHLDTISKLNIVTVFRDLKQEWLYVVWVDLRYSLITRTPPVLDYCIPIAYQYPTTTTIEDERRISANLLMCPESDTVTDIEIRRILLLIYELAYVSTTEAGHREPPYGLIYDIDYTLRVLDAKVNAAGDDSDIDLTLMAIQLNAWAISRFWAPASPNSRRFLLVRGCKMARARGMTNDSNKNWQIWVYSMLCICSLEIGIPREDTPLEELASFVAAETLETFDELLSVLIAWPCTGDWHRIKYEMLWRELMMAGGQASQAQLPKWTNTSHFYVGPVEFYDG